MDKWSQPTRLKMESPGYYRITVQGCLDENWSGRLGGLKITVSAPGKDKEETQLSGELLDQAALLGVLNALYNMHYPLLLVEYWRDRDVSTNSPQIHKEAELGKKLFGEG